MLLSSKKEMRLHPLELVIRRCPVCLHDTEQDAFYADNPDFSVEALTRTTPQFKVVVTPKEEHHTNWSIVSKCRECGYLYRVTGVQQYRLKELKKPATVTVDIAIFCCDICYSEESAYEPAEIFINLSAGKSVYLCERHAAEVEREHARSNSYKSLIDRFNVWKIDDSMPRAVMLDDGKVFVLLGDRGYMEKILVALHSSGGSLPANELVAKLREASSVHRTPDAINAQVEALERLRLVAMSRKGLLGKRELSLTALGTRVAKALIQ